MAHVAAEWTVHPFHFGSMGDCPAAACKAFLAHGKPIEPGPARDPICGACVEGLDWGHVNPACKSSNKVGRPGQ